MPLLRETFWRESFHHHINQCLLRFLRQMIVGEREKQALVERVTLLIADDTNAVRRPSMKRRERLDYHYAHAEGITVWSDVGRILAREKYEKGHHEGLEEGIQQGIERGIQQGLEKGREALLETARKLLATGMEVERVAEITGLAMGVVRLMRSLLQ